MIEAACALVAVAVVLFIFAPAHDLFTSPEKTRLMYLYERKEVVYDNLRDLNFEYKAGKFPEGDYLAMRAGLEDEAASILAEIEALEGTPTGATT
jgi:hypothetical protein